jgi:hypothetical protein
MNNSEYFTEKQYVADDGNQNKFDLALNKNGCSSFRKNGGEICDNCFNEALIEKMQEFNSLQAVDFINYQLNKYSNPLDWLKRLRALLIDNESEFSSFNYSIYLKYLEITEVGIQQLSEEQNKDKITKKRAPSQEFVNLDRIEQIKNLSSQSFDFSKLIALCEEANKCFENECYLSVAMLIRAIIDHVPPIFGETNFQNVYAQNGPKSFKEHMAHLDKSSRKIADQYLHGHIRKKESLPNNTQVNFSQDIDVLLSEICRTLQ